jgi:RNA polymerase sigma-70 factor (ECF subfamily)
MQMGIALGNIAGLIGIQHEESAIVSELKAGSEEAFSWLVAKYHQPIFSVISRTISDAADAADLTQDVFIKVYRGIGGFNGAASLHTWIYRIALREASNQRRWWWRHKRREVTIEAEIGQSARQASNEKIACIRETLVDAGQSPFDSAAQQEVRLRVEEALRHVPEPFRTAVVLRDIEGFSYEEVAEILEVNLGTVKSRLMRGRTHLKAHLSEYASAASKRAASSLQNRTWESAKEAR